MTQFKTTFSLFLGLFFSFSIGHSETNLPNVFRQLITTKILSIEDSCRKVQHDRLAFLAPEKYIVKLKIADQYLESLKPNLQEGTSQEKLYKNVDSNFKQDFYIPNKLTTYIRTKEYTFTDWEFKSAKSSCEDFERDIKAIIKQ